MIGEPANQSFQLDNFIEIHLGFKSLLNDFFYVDHETIERFGIDEKYLVPIYKLGDLDADRYFQDDVPSQRWFFRCEDLPSDLRGTGAGKYVAWGEQQETRLRKQADEQVPWPEAPALQHSKYWYHPAAKVNRTRIAIRKAPGQRFAPFLFSKPVLVDQRMYTAAPRDGVSWKLAAAYLSSSLFPLALETNANLSLGSGYLTYGTKTLRRIPTPELSKVASHHALSAVLDAAEDLWSSRPPDAEELPSRDAVRRLDEALLTCLGLPESLSTDVERDVAHFAQRRLDLNKMRKSDSASSSAADIDAVARDLVPELEAWLGARHYPEDFLQGGPTLDAAFGPEALTVVVEPMLGTATVTVVDAQGESVFSDDMPKATAEILLRAMQLGRRRFAVPLDEDEAKEVLQRGEVLAYEFDEQFKTVLAKTPLGNRYDSRVQNRMLDILGVRLADLFIPVEFGEWRIPPVDANS